MRNSVGPILEGLSSFRVDEGKSTFSPKLDSFIKSEDKTVQDNIKKVLNAIFLWYKKKYGGYTEGQIEQRNLSDCKTLTMEIRINGLIKASSLILMIILGSLKTSKFEVGTYIPHDGYVYNVCLIDGDGKKIEMDEFYSGTNTLVGVACRYDSGGSGKVSTLRIVVSIPIKSS